jgi:uncharacterized protein (TIGR03437 family)
VSAAGSVPGIARGSVASLYGSALADAAASATSVPLPTTLGNVQVSVNGVNAPLWYAGPGQINFQVPFESPLQGQASVVVTRDGMSSSPMTVALTPYAPSIFTYQRVAGVFDPMIVHAANSQLVTPTSPAVAGEYIVVYGTGIGDLTVVPATGAPSPTTPFAAAQETPSATIGAINAPVSFAGLTPGGIGLAQFNIQVPVTVPAGSTLPLLIKFNGVSSASVNLAVQPGTAASASEITTIVGSGVKGFAGDGGTATMASINFPYGLATDSVGNIYFADNGNARIRKVTPQGIITTVAGTGQPGYSGDGGPAVSAQISFANGLAVDSTGDVYIADGNNARVRKITTDGMITTVAGNGQIGYSGDGGPAVAARLGSVDSVVLDAAGNLYISEPLNARIRKVTPTGVISTFAGNGQSGYFGDGANAVNASLNFPTGLAFDSTGDLLIADASNGRIRMVTPAGLITTIAGSKVGYGGDGGPATSASLAFPCAVAADAVGNIYIADTDNHRIRQVSRNGTITTLAGTGQPGYSGDGGVAVAAALNFPYGVTVSTTGTILIADSLNNRVRALTPTSGGR